MREPLTIEHVKPRLLDHWGTTPVLNFIYPHLNRIIKQHDLNMIYIISPGHGGPGIVANRYLVHDYYANTQRLDRTERGRWQKDRGVLASPY